MKEKKIYSFRVLNTLYKSFCAKYSIKTLPWFLSLCIERAVQNQEFLEAVLFNRLEDFHKEKEE